MLSTFGRQLNRHLPTRARRPEMDDPPKARDCSSGRGRPRSQERVTCLVGPLGSLASATGRRPRQRVPRLADKGSKSPRSRSAARRARERGVGRLPIAARQPDHRHPAGRSARPLPAHGRARAGRPGSASPSARTGGCRAWRARCRGRPWRRCRSRGPARHARPAPGSPRAESSAGAGRRRPPRSTRRRAAPAPRAGRRSRPA